MILFLQKDPHVMTVTLVQQMMYVLVEFVLVEHHLSVMMEIHVL